MELIVLVLGRNENHFSEYVCIAFACYGISYLI